MPNNTLEKWDEKTLGELCDVLDSRRKPITKKDRVAGVYPYYGATGILDYVSGWIFDEELVLLGEDGAKWTSGEQSAFKINGKTWVNNHAHVLRPKRDRISDTYLIYNLNFQNLMPYITGTTVPKLNQEKMRSITIPLPPLPEQERIVAKLDKAFEAIDKAKTIAETNLKNAKELFETALNNAFKKTDNIEQLKLDDIAEITSSKRIYKNEYTPLGIPFYRTKEIKELAHNLPISLELYISADKYMEIKNKFGVPSQNDLLISAVGTIGEIYIVQANDKFYFKDGNIIWFKKYKKEINVEYLKYCLTAFVKEIQNMTQGAAYNALTIEKLKEYKINIVNLTEQNEIVRKIKSIRDNIAKLEAIYTKKIKDLDELKQSILQKAFRGEL